LDEVQNQGEETEEQEMEEQEMEEQKMEEQAMEEQKMEEQAMEVGRGSFRGSASIPATLFRMLQPSITIE